MSNTNYQLSRRDQLLIESYKEQTAAWKHEDNLLHRFTSVILPLSIAALGVPYVQKGVPDMLATLGGLTLMTFWAFSCQIMQIKSNTRFSIIIEIERCWKLPGHKDFRDKRNGTYGKKLRSHLLRCCMFWVYLVIAVGLTLRKLCDTCPTQENLIDKTIDSFIIIGVVIVVTPIVIWAMCKARKKVPEDGDDKKAESENDK